MKVRLEVENPREELKAEMYADVVLTGAARSVLAVSEDAVLETGERTLVLVLMPGGALVPRLVKLGSREGTRREVKSGLHEGEQVALGDLLHMSLMCSDNVATRTLARSSGLEPDAFVARMNRKAQAIGMKNARFFDSTGLNGGNAATAADLVMMVQAAHDYPEIRQFSTTQSHELVLSNGRHLHYNNTNSLVKDEDWQIGLQKTGFINEAGKCVVMQATIANTPLVIVLLDSDGKYQRLADANRIKRWIEAGGGARKLIAKG